MTEFKGTPGPWEKHVRKGKILAVIPKYYGERRLENILQTGTIHDDDCGVETCCCVEEHSNARLISAAPDMFEALELIISFNRRQAFDQYGDPEKAESWACVKTARKALNKALGKEGSKCITN